MTKDSALDLNSVDTLYKDTKNLLSTIFNSISADEDKIFIKFCSDNKNENKIYFQLLRLLFNKIPFEILLEKFPCFSLYSEMTFSECPIFFISIKNELEILNWIKDTFTDHFQNFHPFLRTSYDSKKLNSNERNIELIVY